MRKIRIAEHISLDGVIQQTPDENAFPHTDWTAPFRSPAGRDALIAVHGTSFDLLLGRRTYDLWSTHWPHAPAGNPWADSIKGATKLVATHHPQTLAWGPHQAIGPNLVQDIQSLKSQPSGPDIVLWGSSTLTSVLLEHNLADELLLIVYPVLLGTGKRLFAEGTPPRSFDLLSTEAITPAGVLLSTYRFAGPLKTT